MTAPATIAAPIALETKPAEPNGAKWIHVMPRGKFRGKDGRGPYNCDPAAVIEATRQWAGTKQIPVDYDHQSVFAAVPGVGGRAPAAGWIGGLQAREDGIWGLTSWTAAAAAHLEAKEYRYLSPVFRHDRAGNVIAILSVALVNSPNLDQLTAVASMETRMEDDMDYKGAWAELLATLDLAATTTKEELFAKLRETMQATAANSAAPDPSQFVPIGEFKRVAQEVKRLNAGISAQAAQQHVERQITSGHLMPYLREWGVALCTANKPAFDAFVADLAPVVNTLSTPQLPAGRREAAEGNLNETELAVCSRMGLTKQELIEARAFSRQTGADA